MVATLNVFLTVGFCCANLAITVAYAQGNNPTVVQRHGKKPHNNPSDRGDLLKKRQQAAHTARLRTYGPAGRTFQGPPRVAEEKRPERTRRRRQHH